MDQYVLLFEPFKMLADMLVLSMEELGFKVELGNLSRDGDGDGIGALGARHYACVFINLDQNYTDWHADGLMLASKAAALGLPVVMIPDDFEAQDVIRANGWLQIKKPFKLSELKVVMEQATLARDALTRDALARPPAERV